MRNATTLVTCLLAVAAAAVPPPGGGQETGVCPGAGAPSVVYVRGEVERPLDLGAEDLRRMPRQRFQTEDRGGRAVEYEGVLLADILAHAGVDMGSLRGRQAAAVVVAEARDGYRAAYALAELDEAFSDRLVVLVDRKDGAALAEEEGPYRIVMRGEPRHSRWIRQVSCLRLVRP